MTSEGFRKLLESDELTRGEKGYIKDFQFRMGGSFTRALYECIGRADENNLARLAIGFPNEVQGFLAWSRGDLHERASKIAGGDCGFIQDQEQQSE